MNITARELLNRAESDARARIEAGKPVLLSPETTFNAAKDEATVFVFDAIGSWYGLDPREWVPAFNAIRAKTIHIRFNSPGGSVFDAEAMRTAISQHKSKTISHIDGYAASAASTLALAADEVEISSGGMLMIHDAWCATMGRAQDLEACAVMLRKTTATIASAYALRTRKSEKQIRDWMDKETWFTAEEAKSHGFVDRIFTPGQTSNVADPNKAKRARALALAELSLRNF
ncbi:MAG: Clp protease ClpP [Proteobacteria bacterium]|nr:Clp protease ClpP [Pseudomonadota bacterium]